MGALSKYRVLDLSRILAGPWASQMLADFGAHVIKVEKPGSGDDTRGWGPPFIKDAKGHNTAAYFHAANRNKQSIAIDISQAEGQALVRKLAAQSDVVIENFKVGVLARYGLDYASLCEAKPDIIYCSITGFGQTGPYKARAGYDFMIQAMGGLMSVTGEADGAPMKVGVAMADLATGLYASNAIQAALLHREQSGEGQHIDLALLDVQVAALANQALNYLASGVAPGRLGNAHPNIVPYQVFATTDGHIILAVGNDNQFTQFCAIAGAPELAQDARFATNAQRVVHRDTLVPLLQALLAGQSSDWWLQALNDKGVPCGPINNIEAVFNDPQVQHRQMQLQMKAENGEPVPGVANPVKFSKTPVEPAQIAPHLGQHSRTCLQTLGELDDGQINALIARGIVE